MAISQCLTNGKIKEIRRINIYKIGIQYLLIYNIYKFNDSIFFIWNPLNAIITRT